MIMRKWMVKNENLRIFSKNSKEENKENVMNWIEW